MVAFLRTRFPADYFTVNQDIFVVPVDGGTRRNLTADNSADDVRPMFSPDGKTLIGRGVAWCRYESAGAGRYSSERVCIDFKGRRDFLHSLSANWREVTWVAAASYLTRSEARRRFRKHSGDTYQSAEYKVDKDAKEIGGGDNRERAKFWEIWSKGDKKVIWVAHGCEDILDEADPHLELQNYFPCPRPAYGTVQRGSLIPVPDIMQYKDQLDEINTLTGKIHALSDALEAKGFYPAGGGELEEAINAALATHTSGRLLVPISNWASFGNTKEVIVWMPIDMIATTITALVMLRKQIIEDIYQITGMADIMRGDTDPNETLGAQKLKNQYGTTRIRDKQQELVRVARDLVEIASEIITEKFDDATLVQMSQTQLRTEAMVERDAQQIEQALQQIKQQAMQQIQQAQQQPKQFASAAAGAAPPGGPPPAANGAAPGAPQPPADPVQQIVEQAQTAAAARHAAIAAPARRGDDRAGALLPQRQPRKELHIRHRNRQHDHGGRGRREAAPYRVHASARRASSAAGADDPSRPQDRAILWRSAQSSPPRRSAQADHWTARSTTSSSR